MDVRTLATEMDSRVSRGEIVEAVRTYFSDSAVTSDYQGVKTQGKEQMIGKMEGFVNAIAEVRDITHHHTIVDGNLSASEFTFDFAMKDGSDILWHEIIRRQWKDGKVVNEEYFNA